MEYLYQYLVFLAQTITIVGAIIVIVSMVAALGMRRQHPGRGHLQVRKLNEHLNDLRMAVQDALLPAPAARKARKLESKTSRKTAKEEAKALKQTEDPAAGGRTRIFVLDFHGDLQASQVERLRIEITAVLSSARNTDEVVVRLESPGGLVHGYGLAASQLDRIRRHGIPLVVTVDKVAASGGYMMAVVANRVLAAPFAVLGSIGVMAQIPNVHRLLKRHDVDVDVLTAGKYKRTLTVLGENTEEGRQKFIEELEDVHGLFKEFVTSHREGLDIEAVATGETWYGTQAVEMKLVDEVSTSDEYLVERSADADVFEVRWVEHKKPLDRMMSQMESSLDRTVFRWLERISQWRGGV